MHTNIRLSAKIARAISDFSDNSSIDKLKCDRIAQLIDRSDAHDRIEAMVEEYADRIDAMRPEEFVDMLSDTASLFDEEQENIGEPWLNRSAALQPLVS